MGDRRGRGIALTPDLAETLAQVARAMVAARAPWWIIGSAAVALHGGVTRVGDVDVLLSVDDAHRVAHVLGLSPAAGSDHPSFRSAVFFTWPTPPLAVEFMADFAVRTDGRWRAIVPDTRRQMIVNGGTLFLPERDEMRAMLTMFGRPKDRERLAALA